MAAEIRLRSEHTNSNRILDGTGKRRESFTSLLEIAWRVLGRTGRAGCGCGLSRDVGRRTSYSHGRGRSGIALVGSSVSLLVKGSWFGESVGRTSRWW
jgi:hypothetical protein